MPWNPAVRFSVSSYSFPVKNVRTLDVQPLVAVRGGFREHFAHVQLAGIAAHEAVRSFLHRIGLDLEHQLLFRHPRERADAATVAPRARERVPGERPSDATPARTTPSDATPRAAECRKPKERIIQVLNLV
jgi:hypothetical protein